MLGIEVSSSSLFNIFQYRVPYCFSRGKRVDASEGDRNEEKMKSEVIVSEQEDEMRDCDLVRV